MANNREPNPEKLRARGGIQPPPRNPSDPATNQPTRKTAARAGGKDAILMADPTSPLPSGWRRSQARLEAPPRLPSRWMHPPSSRFCRRRRGLLFQQVRCRSRKGSRNGSRRPGVVPRRRGSLCERVRHTGRRWRKRTRAVEETMVCFIHGVKNDRFRGGALGSSAHKADN